MAKATSDSTCERLRTRISLNLALDEVAIEVLSDLLAYLQREGHDNLSPIEHALRGHRIGILKQRAILAASDASD